VALATATSIPTSLPTTGPVVIVKPAGSTQAGEGRIDWSWDKTLLRFDFQGVTTTSINPYVLRLEGFIWSSASPSWTLEPAAGQIAGPTMLVPRHIAPDQRGPGLLTLNGMVGQTVEDSDKRHVHIYQDHMERDLSNFWENDNPPPPVEAGQPPRPVYEAHSFTPLKFKKYGAWFEVTSPFTCGPSVQHALGGVDGSNVWPAVGQPYSRSLSTTDDPENTQPLNNLVLSRTDVITYQSWVKSANAMGPPTWKVTKNTWSHTAIAIGSGSATWSAENVPFQATPQVGVYNETHYLNLSTPAEMVGRGGKTVSTATGVIANGYLLKLEVLKAGTAGIDDAAVVITLHRP
jgi:hypothetical protein